MSEETLTVYHGTSDDVALEVQIGKTAIHGVLHTGYESFSGLFTNDWKYAEDYARTRVDKLIRLTAGKVFSPAVLTFEIPKSLLIDLGPIPGQSNEIRQYATVYNVDPDKVPPDYLHKKFPERREFEDARGIIFYYVPNQYFKESKIIFGR